MKLISNLASLSIAATLLLQSGSFVNATPLFNIPTVASHLNDASLSSGSCEGTFFHKITLVSFLLNPVFFRF